MLKGNPTFNVTKFSCGVTSFTVSHLKAQQPVKCQPKLARPQWRCHSLQNKCPVNSISNRQCLSPNIWLRMLSHIFVDKLTRWVTSMHVWLMNRDCAALGLFTTRPFNKLHIMLSYKHGFRLLAATLTLHDYQMFPCIKLSVCTLFTITTVRHSFIYSHADNVKPHAPRLSARRHVPEQNTDLTNLK